MVAHSQSVSSQKISMQSDREGANHDRRFMLFDLYVGGHHPRYIQHVIEYWCEQNLPGQLDILVTPEFLQKHADFVALSSEATSYRINIVAITPAEAEALTPRTSPKNRAIRALQEWKLLWKYARLMKTTHCMLMYFDSFQTPLAMGLKSPCPVSGIYFRPTFHYKNFAHYQPDRKEVVQHWRERFILPRILKHPQVQTVFCLDPFADKYLNQLSNQNKAVYLPDPIPNQQASSSRAEELRHSLGIDPARQVFLLFGAIDGRKGIYKLLQAVQHLPLEQCQKLCLLLVGQVDSQEAELALNAQITSICQSAPVQIIQRFEFIPEADVFAYLNLADVILAPYQKHVGMSGILLLAAAALKPVLSSDYGLMGEIVRQNGLGLTVNSLSPEALANGLSRLLSEPLTEFCDSNQMQIFAEQHSANQFASTILQHL
jgi:glycosyltransferase involved in cell wall biosynthesis